MGGSTNEVLRVVFCGNKSQCPDCSFMGNRTQIRLHLRMTHKVDTDTKIIINPNSDGICSLCGISFSTRKEVQNHLLKMH